MIDKIERVIRYLLLILSLVLLKELMPAIILDEQRLFNSSAEQEAIPESSEKEEVVFLDELPPQYDGRDYGIAPTIKEQGNVGNCWAMAASTALEASLLLQESYVFSANHISEHNSFSRQEEGGDYTMIMAYLAGWQGPVLRNDLEDEAEMKPVKHVQEMQLLKDVSLEQIKQAVYQYGAVQASLYMDLQNAFSSSVYYNQLTNSYYYNRNLDPDFEEHAKEQDSESKSIANHDVCIIGWDDHFPAVAFNLDTNHNGAFICQNSWGEKFGDQGYFYVSYEDTEIYRNAIVYSSIEDTDNYQNMYQTDECGWVGVIGYGADTAYCANNFQVGSGEWIEAVGLYATGPDTSYEVYVLEEGQTLEHVNIQNPDASGRVRYAGYYTVKLNSPVRAGESGRATVVVKLTTPGDGFPIATEYQADENTANVTIADGDGYISHNGMIWQGTESEYSCNVCMKLFTKEDN